MISKLNGISFKKNIRIKPSVIKISFAILLSNIFFFLIFSNNDAPKETVSIMPGWIEVQFKAEAMTPFQKGKKITLLNGNRSLKLEGVLQANQNEEGKYTAWIKEEDAPKLFQYSNWEILPFLKDWKLIKKTREVSHEIHY
jgi:hypothetical protein